MSRGAARPGLARPVARDPRDLSEPAARARRTGVLLFCSTLALIGPLALRSAVAAPGAPAPSATAASPLGAMSDAFEDLAHRVNPAVVEVFSVGYRTSMSADRADDLISKEHASGSGVIVDPEGIIVTNAHVVLGASRVQVLLATPDESPEPRSILRPRGRLVGARVAGVDAESDLAVLKIDRQDLPHLEFGDSDEVNPAQLVFAFGSPRGLESSVSMGVVSAVARQLRPEDPMIYIQTDAPINPGNSGGPLVDAEGRIVGINTFIFTESGGSEGLGFAIPSNIVKNVVGQIRATGRVRRGEIGVSAQTISPALAAGLGLSRDWGVIVGDVEPKSPADEAGLKIGDIILSLDGKPMENARQLDVNIYRRSVGETVALAVQRGGEQLTLRARVIEREDDPLRFADLVNPERNLVRELGILALDLSGELERLLPHLRIPSGVVVGARATTAGAWEEALRPGDVIHALNGKKIVNLSDLRAALAGGKEGDATVLQVERRGEFLYVAVERE